MKRACEVRRAGTPTGPASDWVLLDADERHRRRAVLVGQKGTRFLMDLPQPGRLRHGDALVLEDQSIIEVVSRPEPLAELQTPTAAELIKLAWHLGNRHVQVQVCPDHLCVRRDHVIEELARALGATVRHRESAFEPEAGVHSHLADPGPNPLTDQVSGTDQG